MAMSARLDAGGVQKMQEQSALHISDPGKAMPVAIAPSRDFSDAEMQFEQA